MMTAVAGWPMTTQRTGKFSPGNSRTSPGTSRISSGSQRASPRASKGSPTVSVISPAGSTTLSPIPSAGLFQIPSGISHVVSGTNMPPTGLSSMRITNGIPQRRSSNSAGFTAPLPIYHPNLTASKIATTNPLTQVGWEGARNLEPDRLPSGSKERARTVRVIELTQNTIDGIKALAETLKRLDMSSLKLDQLNEELFACLKSLERLDIGFNRLSENNVPQCFSKFEHLIEFAAHHNKLTIMPKCMTKLKNVTRLKLGYNEIYTLEGIEKFKKLQVLIIEHNKIESIPKDFFQNLKRLEMLHISNNLLKELSSDIRLLRHLHDLDISGNALTTLPSELFLLPRLEALNASNNQISRLPTVNVKSNRGHLQMVDLSDNMISKFPEHLLLLAEKLDVSKNRIKIIPSNLIKKLDWDTPQELIIRDNPVSNPPMDVCEGGLKCIMQYFQEAKSEMQVYQGLKILAIGSQAAGKTSMIQSLVDQQSRLTSLDEFTCGLDMYDITVDVPSTIVPPDSARARSPAVHASDDETPPSTPKSKTKLNNKNAKKAADSPVSSRMSVKSQASNISNDAPSRSKSSTRQLAKKGQDVSPSRSDIMSDIKEEKKEKKPETRLLNLAIWDFSGHPQYMMSNYHFLDENALVWLVFDLSKYEDEKFQELIGCWIDWIIAKNNKLVAMVIGTGADRLRPKRTAEVCDQVHDRIMRHLQEHREGIEKEIKKITGRAQIPTALTDQLKRYIELLKLKTTIHPKVLPVSSSSMKGFDEVLEGVKMMAVNREAFPFVLKRIPSLWTNVEYYVEDKGWALVIPIMNFDDYTEEISKKFGMKHLINNITHYLHNTGKVLWFSDVPGLSHLVFLRPAWLADILKALFRHDWSESDYTLEEAFKANNLTASKIDKLKKELIEDGVADKELLRCLWAHLMPTDLNKPIAEILGLLLDSFLIGYPLERPGARTHTRHQPSTADRSNDRGESASTQRSRGDSTNRDGTMTGSSSTTAGDSKQQLKLIRDPAKVTRICIPWLRNTRAPKNFKEEYESLVANPCLAAVFRFPRYIPSGLFETLIVRLMGSRFNLDMIYHWKAGLYARHLAKGLRFYLLKIVHDESCTCVRLEVRSETLLPKPNEEEDKKQQEVTDDSENIDPEKAERDRDEQMAENLWNLMLPILKDAEDLIGKYAGARVERHMECPSCHALAFHGEWLTPKEKLAHLPNQRECEACHKVVSNLLLVQPKEKRQVEEFLMQKLKKESEKKAKDAEETRALSNSDVSESETPGGTKTIKDVKEVTDAAASAIPSGGDAENIERKRSTSKKPRKISMPPVEA